MFTLYELAMSAMCDSDKWYISSVYELPEIELQKCCIFVARYIVYAADVINMRDVMYEFLKHGCRKCMEIVLIPLNASWPNVCEALAKSGRLDPLRYAMESGYAHNVNTLCRTAAAEGQIDVLAYLRDYADARFTTITSLVAARKGHVRTLVYLLGDGPRVTEQHVVSMYIEAVSHGHLDIIRYLHGLGYRCKYNLCTEAASAGNIDVLKYVNLKMKIPCTWHTVAAAAHSQCLQCLDYAMSVLGEIYKNHVISY